jgi:TRAP-type uncharacterized transport system substrate-binding protein
MGVNGLLLMLAVAVSGLANNAAAQSNPAPTAYEERKREANENVVTIITSGTVSPYTKLAEDIQNVLDETKTPGGLRVLPILGRGGGHNAVDILVLKGVDMGVMEQEDLRSAQKDNPAIFANVENRIHYITKLANSEFQIIARTDVKSLKDLAGKKVNFLKKLSSTHIACERIFNGLNISVEPVFLDQETASQQLRSGEIAAFARFAPAPHDAFKGFKAADGFHFIPIDNATLSASEYGTLLKDYSPALLKTEFYPDLIAAGEPVSTVAGSLILATYNWPANTDRYRRLAVFVKKFFDNIENFKKPGRHPKWPDINLAYEVPGWKRFGPAQEWLDARKAAEGGPAGKDELRAAFNDFLKENLGSGVKLSAEKQNALFSTFLQWRQRQESAQR